jgi:LPS-assembly protein
VKRTAAKTVLTGFLLASSWLRPAVAADTWALCDGPLVPPASASPERRDDPDTAAQIRADEAEYDRNRREFRFRGNVTLDRADQHAEANRLIYNEATGRADLFGDILYREQGFQISGSDGFVDLDDNRGRITGAAYRIDEGHIHGAASVAQFDSRSRSRYEDVSFTTCDPGREDWWLRAGNLRIDRDANEGVATNAWLSFHGVPLFYTPYINFPVTDERKSGFLAPGLGRSTRSGNTIELPYYWNIAPNYDLITTPRYMSRRGLLLGSQFRYLQPSLEGEVRLDYLPDDERYGDDRWLHSQRHVFQPVDRFRAEIDYNEVSDKDYFDDFGNQLDDLYRQRLESSGSAAYYGDHWDLATRWQRWQVLDEDLQRARYPYERKPQVLLNVRPPALPGGFDMRARRLAAELRRRAGRLETVITALDDAIVGLAGIETGRGHASVTADQALADLQRFVQGAERYQRTTESTRG